MKHGVLLGVLAAGPSFLTAAPQFPASDNRPEPVFLDYKHFADEACYNDVNFDASAASLVFFHGYQDGSVPAGRGPSLNFSRALPGTGYLGSGWEGDHNVILADMRPWKDMGNFPKGVLDAQKAIWTPPERYRLSREGNYFREVGSTVNRSLCAMTADAYRTKYRDKVQTPGTLFVGHSLGFQTAVCVAETLWRTESDRSLAYLPQAVVGLGVYFSGKAEQYLGDLSGSQKPLRPGQVVEGLVERLQDYDVKVGVIRTLKDSWVRLLDSLVDDFPSAFRVDGIFKNMAGVIGETNTSLMKKIAYQEVRFDYFDSTVAFKNDAERYKAMHFLPVYYFFMSKGMTFESGWSAEGLIESLDDYRGKRSIHSQDAFSANHNVGLWSFIEEPW